jgi:hypothetical protein
MLDAAYRILANLVYLVPLVLRRFKAKEPGSQVLAAGATKARRADRDSEIQYEAGWITAKRGTLILTQDKLVCGSWEIPLHSVSDAVLLRARALFATTLVLKVSTTDGQYYQFGLQYDPAWENQTALKLNITDGKIKDSRFSITIRIILWTALVIWLVKFLVQWLS